MCDLPRETGLALSILVVAVVLAVGVPAVPTVGSHPSAPRGESRISARTGIATGVPYRDWPEFHQDPQLTGYDPNSSLNTSNAGQLGLRWSTDLYGAALDSPVAAYSSYLNETLVYVGTESGNLIATNLNGGNIVWSTWLGSPLRATPIVSGGAVFVGTDENPELVKLNASSGAIDCSVNTPAPIEGSPTIAAPASGLDLLYVGTLDTATKTGPFLAVSTQNCSIAWKFTGYPGIAGSWDSVSFATTANGSSLVLFGTADPDSAVYALNASTGAKAWRFQTYNPAPGVYDVGAGVTIGRPGLNGFADGVAYVPNKFGILYALDLANGSQLWSLNFDQQLNLSGPGESTPALAGSSLVLGTSVGLVDVDARNGSIVWNCSDPSGTEAISSPAIAGAPGTDIAVFGDLAGSLDVVAATDGAPLFAYGTGEYITASPAIIGGNVLVASADGFLYDFAVGAGSPGSPPSTYLTSPSSGATIANPNGQLTLNGTATAPGHLAGVRVAVRSGGVGGPWYDARNRSWLPGPYANPANLSAPGANASSWSFPLPIPAAGGTYEVIAYANDTVGQSDLRAPTVDFVVLPSTKGPHLHLAMFDVPPGDSVTVTGGGYSPSEVIVFVLGSVGLGSTTASPTGSVPATPLHIPSTMAFGLAAIVGTGRTSGRVASVAVEIQDRWQQSGYDALHGNFERNDPTLNAHVKVGSAKWMLLAWHFHSGAPILGSPAVVDGVVYVTDTAGMLFAVDSTNGGVLWQYPTSGGTPVTTAPAVDASAGLLVVALGNGKVAAIGLSVGGPLWTANVGGNVTAPVLAGGMVYVTSQSGRIVAFYELNGSRYWATAVHFTIRASPTVDTVGQLVLIAGLSGRLVAIGLTTGKAVWSRSLGAPIFASPAVLAGSVYAETSGGYVTAVNETSGKIRWSDDLGGNFTAAPTVGTQGIGGSGGPKLFVGSTNRTLYSLLAATGAVVFTVWANGSIVDTAGTDGIVVYETSNGLVEATRGYTSLRIWFTSVGSGLTGSLAIVDGTIYLGTHSGYLDAYTPYGQTPE